MGSHMRQALSIALAFLVATHSGPPVFGADSVTGQITSMPAGTNIEIRLNNKQTLRGTRGELSGSGFTLLNPQAGNRQVAFGDVNSVKRLDRKSHTTRNVLIVVGIAVVAVVVAGVIYVKRCPLGCGTY